MAQPRLRRRGRDMTPREYAQQYQEMYGPPSNPLVTLFWLVFSLATFVLMLIAIQAALFNLFKVDPFDWAMTRLAGPSQVHIGTPATNPTAAIQIQSQQPAAVVVPQVQEQPQAQPQPVPTDAPQEPPAQPQEQPSELQAPVQEQAAPVATAVPTIAPTAAPKPKPTSWATADAFVVKSDFVKATPDARWTGGWKSIPTK
jgi:outer membrane biosynthesis protein TonB